MVKKLGFGKKKIMLHWNIPNILPQSGSTLPQAMLAQNSMSEWGQYNVYIFYTRTGQFNSGAI